MKPLDIQNKILFMEKAESTNTELRKRKNRLDNLSIVLAFEQTKGRGQGDHTWFSSPKTNLTFSILYSFPPDSSYELKASDALLVTEITALAIRDYLLLHGIESRIKWPNDIWVGDKKICGILIENTIDGKYIRESIVGIGLNLNETAWPDGLPNPVSLKELSGRTYDIKEELLRLQASIAGRYETISGTAGRECLDAEFHKHLFRLD